MMAQLYKVVVTGPFNAGKTTFVNTLSDIEAVNTDKAATRPAEAKTKAATTVALDYGSTFIYLARRARNVLIL
jgi:signal recognition particle receptor subunit beta